MDETKQFLPHQAEWLFATDVQSLLATLSANEGQARIVGGAVRNALLGEEIGDIDIATTLPPQEVMRLAQQAGFHALPTGIDFGTVTIIINHRPFEVTSLRVDVSSDGRHAIVSFGHDWHEDAKRRDFTINALYCDADGTIYDYVGGVEDIHAKRIRFIGDAKQRIEEDYLRILRFFRFFAYYGKGRPDKDAIKAIARQRDGLKRLSAERVWKECKKLLGAPQPLSALLWMRMSGVLSQIVPESEKWGIDLTQGLIKAEAICDFSPDPILRLASMIPPDRQRVEILAQRLKLAKIEKKRLINWANLEIVTAKTSPYNMRKRLYLTGKGALEDQVKLALGNSLVRSAQTDTAEFDAYVGLLSYIGNWQRPILPLNGQDLIAHGYKSGPEIGKILAQIEADWMNSDFSLTKAQLLAKLPQRL